MCRLFQVYYVWRSSPVNYLTHRHIRSNWQTDAALSSQWFLVEVLSSSLLSPTLWQTMQLYCCQGLVLSCMVFFVMHYVKLSCLFFTIMSTSNHKFITCTSIVVCFLNYELLFYWLFVYVQSKSQCHQCRLMVMISIMEYQCTLYWAWLLVLWTRSQAGRCNILRLRLERPTA